jgi:hypothetical protein
MSLWIYLALFPFQIVASFNYLIIPRTALSAFFLLLGLVVISRNVCPSLVLYSPPLWMLIMILCK